MYDENKIPNIFKNKIRGIVENKRPSVDATLNSFFSMPHPKSFCMLEMKEEKVGSNFA